MPHFSRGVSECIYALSMLRNRMKKGDAFDLTGFLAHCEAARQRIPADEDTLQVLGAELEAIRKAKLDAKSPWEKLDIDWDEFHPRAREGLDDPFFWDSTDDFSPNGNDTGADLLDSYRRWIGERKKPQAGEFLDDLATEWGYDNVNGMDDDMRNEAAVALAFADIKLRGECDPVARELALQAVDRQRKHAREATDWPHREGRLASLDTIEAALRRLAR